jgi:DNA polymerase III delta prime subunit
MPDTVLPVHATLSPLELQERRVAEAEKVFHGKQEVVQLAVASPLARGHLLVEDIPGVGKTTLAHALGSLLGHGRFRTQHHQETRAYLRLVKLCRRAGVVGPAAVGPLELVEVLERRRHPAARSARRLVDIYPRAQFGADPLDEVEQRVLTDALGNARSHLRPA